jgi:hypothetical protein
VSIEAVSDLPSRPKEKGATTPPPLSVKDLQQRLELSNPKLVAELFELTKKQVDGESARLGRLDSKASSLLAAVGFSLTVASGFFGQVVLLNPNAIAVVPEPTRHFAFVAFFLAVIGGLVAAFCAMVALRVKAGHVDVSGEALFDARVLQGADSEDDAETGLAEYRRFMTVHLWDILQQNAVVLAKKANWIRFGQVVFMSFLTLLISVCFSLGISMI